MPAASPEMIVDGTPPCSETPDGSHAKGLSYLVYRDKKAGKFVTVTQENLEQAQEESTIEVWSKDPSVQAFTDLLNRTLDKPTETLEATVTVGGLDVRIREARKRVAG